MVAYIIRRLLLVIPTLLGVMIVNFALIQFVPGGPVEQVLAQLEGEGDVFAAITGGDDAGIGESAGNDQYAGARGLPQEYIEQLEREFGLDRRYFRSIKVVDLVLEKMPVSISLGLWSTLLIYLVSIPLGVRKGYGIPSFLFAIMLLVLFAGGSYWQIFPLRGLTSNGFEEMSLLAKIGDYFWHMALPIFASVISGFATLTLLTKNSFLDEIRKQYVVTARAKGLTENRVLFGHIFRNAMLIVIAGFPSLFIGVFFGGSLFIETIFSLDGLGRLGFEAAISRDYPVMFGTLFAFGLLGLIVGILSDLMYVIIDPRIDFEARG